MSTIYEKANEIKNEKDLKIIPENIKKDVTILGVTGTLEGGGSSLYTIRQFESKSAMYAVESPLGEKAIVYHTDLSAWTEGTVSKKIIFSPSFTYSGSFSGSYIEIVSSDSEDWNNSINISLESSNVNVYVYCNGSSSEITYTRDGDTWSNGEEEDMVYEFPKDMHAETRYSSWNPVCGQFMSGEISQFEGLYEIREYEDYTIVPAFIPLKKMIANTVTQSDVLYINDDYAMLNAIKTASADTSMAWVCKVTATTSYRGQVCYDVDEAYICNSESSGYNIYTPMITKCEDGKWWLCAFSSKYSSTSTAFSPYTCNVRKYANGEVTVDARNITTYDETKTYSGKPNYITKLIDIDDNWYVIGYAGYAHGENGKRTSTSIKYFPLQGIWSTSSATCNLVGTGFQINKYQSMPTQFSDIKANQLLEGLTVLGANGAVSGDGSIYNNINTYKVLCSLIGKDELYHVNECSRDFDFDSEGPDELVYLSKQDYIYDGYLTLIEYGESKLTTAIINAGILPSGYQDLYFYPLKIHNGTCTDVIYYKSSSSATSYDIDIIQFSTDYSNVTSLKHVSNFMTGGLDNPTRDFNDDVYTYINVTNSVVRFVRIDMTDPTNIICICRTYPELGNLNYIGTLELGDDTLFFTKTKQYKFDENGDYEELTLNFDISTLSNLSWILCSHMYTYNNYKYFVMKQKYNLSLWQISDTGDINNFNLTTMGGDYNIITMDGTGNKMYLVVGGYSDLNAVYEITLDNSDINNTTYSNVMSQFTITKFGNNSWSNARMNSPAVRISEGYFLLGTNTILDITNKKIKQGGAYTSIGDCYEQISDNHYVMLDYGTNIVEKWYGIRAKKNRPNNLDGLALWAPKSYYEGEAMNVIVKPS